MLTWFKSLQPLQLLTYGYFSLLLIGFLILSIPVFHVSSITTIDNLFISTSALSTTGLATINIAEKYNWGGQLIILLMIQIGGLGYMSIGSFVVMLKRRKLSGMNKDLVRYDFGLPEDFKVKVFIRDLVITTVAVELIGAIFLSLIFWWNGESAYIWKGIFHSISAFCTAGFSIFSDGLEGYRDNFYLNTVISLLSIGGALGFIVFTDLFEKFSGKKQKITFTSRIIIRFTFLGILLGASILFLTDSTISQLPPENRILVSLFQSMTAFTTVGFNTHPIGEIAHAPLFFILLLMVVGASPAGTGGGMKSTTITALYAQLKSTFRGDQDAIYMNRKIPEHRVRMATSNFFFYVIVIFIGTFLLLLIQPQNTFAVLFEAVSALGTVGISTGITPDLTILGKVFVIALMFLGRIGPLSFGMALFSPKDEEELKEEDLAI
ncbi:MAG: potassium transporter TrkG [Bacteroidia bacterium]